MRKVAKVLGFLLGAVAALCAGIVFSVFGGFGAASKLVSLSGLPTVLAFVLFLGGCVNAFRRVFPRGRVRP